MAYQITDSDARILRKMAARERRQTGSSPRSQRGQVLASPESLVPIQLQGRFSNNNHTTPPLTHGWVLAWEDDQWGLADFSYNAAVFWPSALYGTHRQWFLDGSYYSFHPQAQFLLDPEDVVWCVRHPMKTIVIPDDGNNNLPAREYAAYMIVSAPWRTTRLARHDGTPTASSEWQLYYPGSYWSDGTQGVATLATHPDLLPDTPVSSYTLGIAHWHNIEYSPYRNKWLVSSITY